MDASDPLMATFTKPNGIEVSKDECSLYVTQDNDVIREIKFEDSDCVSSLQFNRSELDLKIYPVPTKGELIIDNNTGLIFNQIDIIDASGFTIGRLSDENLINSAINISNLNAGIYFLTFTTSTDQLITRKIFLE